MFTVQGEIISMPPVLPGKIEKALPFLVQREKMCSTGSTGFSGSFAPAGSRAKYCIRVAEGNTAFYKANIRWFEEFFLGQKDTRHQGQWLFA